jgi:hypothetical protein
MYRICVFGLLALGLATTRAHHGAALYFDLDNIATLEGEVLSVSWRNPHVMFEIRRTDDGGTNEVWEIEASSMNALLRVGVEAGVVGVGDRVTFTGALSRHGLPSMAGHVMTLEDGTDVAVWPRPAMRLGQEVSPAPISTVAAEASRSTARGIFRVWSRPDLRGPFLVSDHLPFTPAALAVIEAWNPLEDDPSVRCIPRGMASLMNNPLPVEFVDQGDSILIRLEEWDTERVIHLTDLEGPVTQPRTPLGYSVGRWDGATLVVTTSRISDIYFDDQGAPQSEDLVIVERFTLSEDETRLDYESLHTDPLYFAEPARLTGHWNWVPGEQIRRFDCVTQ